MKDIHGLLLSEVAEDILTGNNDEGGEVAPPTPQPPETDPEPEEPSRSGWSLRFNGSNSFMDVPYWKPYGSAWTYELTLIFESSIAASAFGSGQGNTTTDDRFYVGKDGLGNLEFGVGSSVYTSVVAVIDTEYTMGLDVKSDDTVDMVLDQAVVNSVNEVPPDLTNFFVGKVEDPVQQWEGILWDLVLTDHAPLQNVNVVKGDGVDLSGQLLTFNVGDNYEVEFVLILDQDLDTNDTIFGDSTTTNSISLNLGNPKQLSWWTSGQILKSNKVLNKGQQYTILLKSNGAVRTMYIDGVEDITDNFGVSCTFSSPKIYTNNTSPNISPSVMAQLKISNLGTNEVREYNLKGEDENTIPVTVNDVLTPSSDGTWVNYNLEDDIVHIPNNSRAYHIDTKDSDIQADWKGLGSSTDGTLSNVNHSTDWKVIGATGPVEPPAQPDPEPTSPDPAEDGDTVLNLNGGSAYLDFPEWTPLGDANGVMKFTLKSVSPPKADNNYIFDQRVGSPTGTQAFQLKADTAEYILIGGVTMVVNGVAETTFTPTEGETYEVEVHGIHETVRNAFRRQASSGTVFNYEGICYDLELVDDAPIQGFNVVNGNGVDLYGSISMALAGDYTATFSVIVGATGTTEVFGSVGSDNGRCVIESGGDIIWSANSDSSDTLQVAGGITTGLQYTILLDYVGGTGTIYVDGVSVGSSAFGGSALSIQVLYRANAGYSSGAVSGLTFEEISSGTVYEYDLSGSNDDDIPVTIDSTIAPASYGTWLNYVQGTDQEYIPYNSRFYQIQSEGNDTQADYLGDGSTDGTLYSVDHATDWRVLGEVEEVPPEEDEEYILNFDGVSSYMQYSIWEGDSDNFELHFKIRNVIGTTGKQPLIGANVSSFMVYALNSNIELNIPLSAGGSATFTSSTFGQDGGDKQISVYREGDSWRVVTDIDDETEEHSGSASIKTNRVGTGLGLYYLSGSVSDLYITDNSPIQDTNVVNGDEVSLYADLGLSLSGDFTIDQSIIFSTSTVNRIWGNADDTESRCYIQNVSDTALYIVGSSGGSGTTTDADAYLIDGIQYNIRSVRAGGVLTVYIDDVLLLTNSLFGSGDLSPLVIHKQYGSYYGAGSSSFVNITIANGDVYSYDLAGDDGDVIPVSINGVLTPASDGTWYNYDQATDQEFIPANSRYYPIGTKDSDTQPDELGDGSTDGTLYNVNHATDWELVSGEDPEYALNFDGVSSYMDIPYWSPYGSSWLYEVKFIFDGSVPSSSFNSGQGNVPDGERFYVGLHSSGALVHAVNSDAYTSVVPVADTEYSMGMAVNSDGTIDRLVDNVVVGSSTESPPDLTDFYVGKIDEPTMFWDGILGEVKLTDNAPIQDTNVVNGDGVDLYGTVPLFSLVSGDTVEFDLLFRSHVSDQYLIDTDAANTDRGYLLISSADTASALGYSVEVDGGASGTYIDGKQYSIKLTATQAVGFSAIYSDYTGGGSPAISALSNLVVTKSGDVYSYDLTGDNVNVIPATVNGLLTPASDGAWTSYTQGTDQEYMAANSRHYPIGTKGSDTQPDVLGDGSTDGTLYNVDHSTDWEEK